MLEILNPLNSYEKPHNLKHFIHKEHVIGDVHPIYNHKEKKWYMFYLMPNSFQAKLIVSSDLLNWEEKDIYFSGLPNAPYFVLGIMAHNNTYYSWYGQYDKAICSSSSDLINWKEDSTKSISIDMNLFKNGARDPFVFIDKESNCFRMVTTAYFETHNHCAIASTKTKDLNLNSWTNNYEVILEFKNEDYKFFGEPEVTQVMYINNRWYIFSSIARRTRHHVGPMSYWMGPIGKKFDEVNWRDVKERIISSNDLCAAQIASLDGKNYVWGWIPQDSLTNKWGGHLSFPLELKALPTGELYVSYVDGYMDRLKKNLIYSLNKDKYETGYNSYYLFKSLESFILDLEFDNVPTVFSIKFDLIEFFKPTNIIKMIIDNSAKKIYVFYNDFLCTSKSYLSTLSVSSLNVFVELDILEIEINGMNVIQSKIGEGFAGKRCIIINEDRNLRLKNIEVFNVI